MHGPIHEFLAADHRRLEVLLASAAGDLDAIDLKLYGDFRAGLLRHIGMEENILIPAARRARGKLPSMAAQIRVDHGAIAALLVPIPSPEIIRVMRTILSRHNHLEEDAGGLYDTCENWIGAGVESLVAILQNAPFKRLRPMLSDPGVLEATRRAVSKAGYHWNELKEE